ncbi:hypothetical protein [Agromyces sp. NPDC055658]
MKSSKQRNRIYTAQVRYKAALAQAQAVPSMYTRRELKRADRALRLATLPTWKRVVPSVVMGGVLVAVVVSCSANAAADRAEIERCIAAHEQALAEAGSDRAVTPGEVAACNDPERRAFILGDR